MIKKKLKIFVLKKLIPSLIITNPTKNPLSLFRKMFRQYWDFIAEFTLKGKTQWEKDLG